MKERTILHLCADLGSDSAPYRESGYNVITVGQKEDVRTFQPPPDVYGIIANPPCTHFSFARTNAKDPRDLRLGMELVIACLRIIWECQYRIESDSQRVAPLEFWVLENPNAMLRWFLGKPAMMYHPYEYGDQYSKSTCLWGNFNEPSFRLFSDLNRRDRDLCKTNSRKLPESDGLSQSDRRSICSPGFSKAFFEANQ